MMNCPVKSKRLCGFFHFSQITMFFANLLMLSGPSLYTQSAAELIAQGDAFHRQLDTYNAFKTYKAAYELDTTNFDAIWKMAGELIDMGNELPKSNDQILKYQEAVAVASKAVELNPNHSKGHVLLAAALEKIALYKSGGERIKLLNQSRTAAEKAIMIDPGEDLGHHLLGRWHREMTNIGWLTKAFSKVFVVSTPPATFENAVDHFTRAISINPNYIAHYLELGKTYLFLEKWAEAGEAFTKVTELPLTEKGDSKYQRDARHYLQLLQQGNYSELLDSIEE